MLKGDLGLHADLHRRLIIRLSHYLRYLFFFSILLLVAPVQAENLFTIYTQALEKDPTFRGSFYSHQASREISKQAWAEYFPELVFEGDYINSYQDVISSDNAVFAEGDTDFPTELYTFSLTQPIFNFGSIVKIIQSKKQLSSADIELEIARQDLILNVAELYFDALAAKDNVAFAQAEQTAVAEHLKLARALHKAGKAPITDRYDAEARMADVRAAAIEAVNEMDDTLQALREVAGDLRDTSLAALQEEFALENPDPDIDVHWIDSALKGNLNVRMQQFEVQVAEDEVRRQRAGHLPTLQFIGRWNRRNTDGTLFGGGSEVDTTDAILRFNLPIFQGGFVASKVREAQMDLMVAKQDLEKEVRAADRKVQFAYQGIKAAISKVKALKDSMTAQKLALFAKQQGFEAGLLTGLYVLDAERDLYSVKRDYAQARYNYILNTLRLKKAVGALTQGDVVRVNALLQQ